MDTDKLFTGQRLDDTGLYYYNARYYDPEIGRFISPDSAVQIYPGLNGYTISLTVDLSKQYKNIVRTKMVPNSPQCLNRYSYCANNPLKYIDSSGNFALVDDAVFWFAAGVAATGLFIAYWASGCAPTEAASRSVDTIADTIGDFFEGLFSGDDISVTVSPGIIYSDSADDTIQTGGHTIKKPTADALNDYSGEDYTAREYGRSLEKLKHENLLPKDHHGKIKRNGDYCNDKGEVIDNIFEYLQ